MTSSVSVEMVCSQLSERFSLANGLVAKISFFPSSIVQIDVNKH